MRNIRLTIEYDGSRYDGWQKQAGDRAAATIQDKIEAVLNKMEEREDVELIGAARTEAGVHAYMQTANYISSTSMTLTQIEQYLNRYLPRDIAVLHADEADERFHASFNAASFEYEYKITMGDVPSVFDRKYNYYCFKRLDTAKMKQAAAFLKGKHDLKTFSDNKRQKKSTERTIYAIDIYGDEKELSIRIKADDFWPNMARIIVGTLVEVGLGNIKPQGIDGIILSKDRRSAGPTLDAKGLFLSRVNY